MPLNAVRCNINMGSLKTPFCSKAGCNACEKAKFRCYFPGMLTNEETVGRLHADVKCPVKVTSSDGYRYLVTIIDEHSRFVHVEAIKRKDDASEAVLRFVKYFEWLTGTLIRSLHTDGGGEFAKAAQFLQNQGVEVSLTTSYTPESNGFTERTHGTIVSLTRPAILQANLPENLCHYAIRHVMQSRNAVVHRTTKNITYVVAFGRNPPYLQYILQFGCRAMYRLGQKTLQTFSSRIQEGVCLLHDGGGVYYVLGNHKVLRT